MSTKRNLNLSFALTAGLLCLGAAGAQGVYNPDLTNRTVAGQWTVVGPDAALGTLDRAPTFSLGADGTIGGFAGCNTLTGTYAARGSAFFTLPLGLTRMACDPAAMQAEQNVMSRLQAAYKVGLEGDTMRLRSGAGDLLLRRTGPALGLEGTAPKSTPAGSAHAGDHAQNHAQKGDPMQHAALYTPTLEQNGQRLPLGPEAGFTVDIQGDQVQLSGKVGCNQINTTATINGSSLTFGGVQAARMLCAPAEAKAEAVLTDLLGGPVQASPLEDGWKLMGSGVTLTLQERDHQAQGEVHSKQLLGQYRSSGFVLDGEAIDASDVRVSFNGLDNATPISVTAGCNNLGFSVEGQNGQAVLTPLLTTLVTCEPETMEKEEALQALLTGAAVVHHSDSVTLKSERGELTLTPMTDADMGVDNAALMGTYKLVNVAKAGQDLDLAGYSKPVTLTLEQNGEMLRVGGVDGCNAFGGAAVLEGHTLRASDLMGTLVYCSSLETLPDLGKQLLSGVEVRSGGGAVVLEGQQGGENMTWTFERQ